MRLRKRFQINTLASVSAILALGLVVGSSLRESRKASEAEEVATKLQQEVLERGIVGRNYFIYGEERSKAQRLVKSARIASLLRQAEERFEGAEERRALREIGTLNDRGNALFAAAARARDDSAHDESRREAFLALQERAGSRLLLFNYELNGRAKRLVQSAAKRTEATRRLTVLLMFVLIGGVLAITVANAVIAARLVEKRINRLRAGAGRVAAGHLEHRLNIAGNDELAELGAAFDAMTARLQALNEELNARVAQLENANRELDAFSHSVSHDLRAPLRAIDGFSKAVLADQADKLNAQAREDLERVRKAAQHMARLIDDLLKLSRVSRAQLGRLPLDLGRLARNTIDELRRAEPGRRVEVTIAKDLRAEGDPDLLQVVLDNLLGNAWKFSSRREHAHLELGIAEVQGERAFFVRDDGAGFDMAYADKLFGAFQRLHATTEFEGTGIGLATVQRIVHRHGGRIWAESAVGQGATFYFTLGARLSVSLEGERPWAA
jgi:signal transduction histidine kinase